MKDKILPIISILFCALMAVLVLFQMNKISEQLASMQTYVSGMNNYLGVETEVTQEDELVIKENTVKKDDIEVTTTDKGNYLLFTYTNNGSEVLTSMDVSVVFYDEEGKMINMATDYIYYLFPGCSFDSQVFVPTDQEGNVIQYNSFEIDKKISNSTFHGTNMMSDVTYEYNQGTDSTVMLKVTNNSTLTALDNACFQIVFYSNGEIIDTYTCDAYNIAPAESGYVQCTPYGQASYIIADSIEVKLMYAYGDSYDYGYAD
ncbi:MAG: hypothetical protein K5682_01050 [Lachnospiraceae bacterium]|nr:hypothetical protein [Lachnospiraceae bacterium]